MKIGFTLESNNIEKKIKNFKKKKADAIKIKLLESNSILAEMKRELEKKISEI